MKLKKHRYEKRAIFLLQITLDKIICIEIGHQTVIKYLYNGHEHYFLLNKQSGMNFAVLRLIRQTTVDRKHFFKTNRLIGLN